jgi:spore germination cell wall hydrolase CwlJ-like protein
MSFDIEVAARTIYGEARNQPYDGMVAVAWVMLNRLHSKKWFSGETLAETCLMPKQFSCWNTGDPNRVRMLRVAEDDPLLVKIRTIVEAVVAGQIQDPTKGATHYRVVNTPAAWAIGYKPVATIGDHEFFKNIN